jgi:uncharacterized membrane protein YedE/YeeE
MLERVHHNRRLQLVLGLVIGICFGFLLQRGGATRYDVIIGQLLLTDWTVAKIIMTAVLVGMVGIYFFRRQGLVRLHKKSGSFGATVIGSLIFGVGFGLLGYCPGTMAGAVGQGSLDALVGGVVGMVVGAAVYAKLFPWLDRHLLDKGDFGSITIHGLLRVSPWSVIVAMTIAILLFLVVLEAFHL